MFESEQDLSSIISEWLLLKSIEKKIPIFCINFFFNKKCYLLSLFISEAGTTFFKINFSGHNKNLANYGFKTRIFLHYVEKY